MFRNIPDDNIFIGYYDNGLPVHIWEYKLLLK